MQELQYTQKFSLVIFLDYQMKTKKELPLNEKIDSLMNN